MGYGTGYIDAITSSGNLTIVNNIVSSGNITASNISSSLGSLYPLTSSSPVDTTSGTSVQASTSIPSWAKRITVILNSASLSGTDLILVQMGYGATPTWQTSGYTSNGENYGAAVTTAVKSTSGFITGSSSTAAYVWNISYVFSNVPSTNTWIGSFSGATSNTVAFGGGFVTLSGALTSIRLVATGSNSFDAGTVNITYE